MGLSPLAPQATSLSPLAPVLRGEGPGVRGESLAQLPLTPNPSPRSTGERGERLLTTAFGKRAQFWIFSRPRMASRSRGPREVGIAAVCGAGGSKRSVAGHRGVHGSAEEPVAPAGLDGTPIELLRDQKAVARRDRERSFYDGGCCRLWLERESAGRRAGRVGIGFLSSAGRRGALSSRAGDRSVILADGLVRVSSVFHPWLRTHAVEFPGFACIGSAWRPAWFGLMRIFPPFPPHRACRKFVVLSSWFLVI